MAPLTPADKAFIVSQYYAGKTAVEIQRKFKRDRKQTVALSTDHQRMTQASMLDVVRDVVIPFMKSSGSQKKIMDCTTVYHNETIYKELRDNDIEPYPSGGRSFDVDGGYPPNSHDCMPCELINDHLKENSRKAFEKLRKSHGNMKSLQTIVAKEARKIDIDFIRARIADLPKILRTIEERKGGRTKY